MNDRIDETLMTNDESVRSMLNSFSAIYSLPCPHCGRITDFIELKSNGEVCANCVDIVYSIDGL